MMNNPLVSIIIPTFNRAHLIVETLNSIKNQTFRNWECIVVDDGSTDNTKEVIGSFIKADGRFFYAKRPEFKNKGANACRNYGLELSNGKYINWFDDDDLMHPEKIEIQFEALETKDYPFSVCQTNIFEGSLDNILGLRSSCINSDHTLLDFISLKLIFLTQAPFFKKTFLTDHNINFDEELQAAQEWEFICRVLFYSPIYHVSELPLVFFRRHKASISHGMNYSERKWQYFLARKKVYMFLKSQSDYKDKLQTEIYLQDYLKAYFRELVFSKNYSRILKVYNELIKPMYSHMFNMRLGFFLFFVFITGRGYNFRKRFIP